MPSPAAARHPSHQLHSGKLLAAYIHDDDIGSNLFDVFIRNADIRFSTEQIKKFIAAGDKNLADLAAALVKFQIRNPSEFFTVPHIDHIFTFQFGKKHVSTFLFAWYKLFYAREIKGFKKMNIFLPICE